jgi:2,4-dienoyl-CoA reductase-like NADH-dependent reductase (Old Yellow Enzyme family)
MLLSEPFSVAGYDLPNRIVMPPLVIWRAGRNGLVTDAHLEHYDRSAGPGLMIVEATTVSPEGRLAATQLGIWGDEQVEGLADLARIIHQTGAIAGIQIHHAGAKATLEITYGEPPLVPSLTERSPEGAQEMTEDDIERTIEAFAAATRRAVSAGFDYVELHGAHGYLMSQFLSGTANTRTDEWGGSLANRMRFILETYRRCVVAAEGQLLVGIRLGLADGRPGSIAPEDGLAVARELAALDCPLIHVSHGGGMPAEVVPEGSPYSAFLHLAAMVKAEVPVAVIGVGSVYTPEMAEQVLREGMADLVAVGRGILADPSWAVKAVEGREDEIERCVDCKPRCFHFKAEEAAKCPARRRLAKREA